MNIERLKKLQNEVSNMVFIALSKLTGKNTRASVVKFGEELQTLIDESIARQSVKSDIGETSDGYHTFNELYEHRTALFATLCNMRSDISWKSMKHADGTMYDGMFIAGIKTPDGQYTYHCEMKYWYMFAMTKEIDKAPVYDGHQPSDYPRLLALSENSLYRQSVKSEEVQEAIEELLYGSWQSSKDGYPITLGDKTIGLAIAALQEYQPWISVREKLPERGNHYLCCEYDTMSIFVAYYDASGWQRPFIAPFYREVTVTHWKPLPEPPKGELHDISI